MYATVATPPCAQGAAPLYVAKPPPPIPHHDRAPALFEGAPDGLNLYKFDPDAGGYRINAFDFGEWSDPFMTIEPGEGVVIRAPSSPTYTLRFAGEIMGNSRKREVLTWIDIYATMAPFGGQADTELGFPIQEGDIISRMNASGNLDPYYFANGSWSPEPPVIPLGESFWVTRSAAGEWRQNLSIWQPGSMPLGFCT